MSTVYGQYAAYGFGSDLGDDWRHSAACRDHDPEIWFPVGTGPIAQVQANHAKSICAPCPSRIACLKWALETGIDDGVWGGTGEEERRALRAPKHLTEQQRAAIAKSAQVRADRAATRTYCDHGHELTPENTFMNGNHRACRICSAERAYEYRRRMAVSS